MAASEARLADLCDVSHNGDLVTDAPVNVCYLSPEHPDRDVR
jgi:hypothetical protein